MGLPSNEKSQAVLIGCSVFEHLEDLPAVRNNVAALADCLTEPDLWGLKRENLATVIDPISSTDILDPLFAAAENATDTLIIYYSGHGLVDRRNNLLLSLQGSHQQKSWTSTSFSDVHEILLDSKADRRIVILDCCYSSWAFSGAMSAFEQDAAYMMAHAATAKGTFALAAAGESNTALAPPGEQYTAFTGSLIGLLQNGHPEEAELWDLNSLYRRLREALQSRGWPTPQKNERDNSGDIEIARNRAESAPAKRPDPNGSSSEDSRGSALLGGYQTEALSGALQLTAPLIGHSRFVNSVATMTLDDTLVVVSGSDDQTIGIWDARTGRQLRQLQGHTDGVNCVCVLTVDGAPSIVSGSDDRTVRLWDARSGRERRKFTGHSNIVNAVAAFTLDGAPAVVSCSGDRTIRIWDVRSRQQLRQLEGHTLGVASVAIAELDDAPVIVSGSYDNTVRIWDARTGDQLRVLEDAGGKGLAMIAMGDVTAFATCSGNTIQIWDTSTGQRLRQLAGRAHTVYDVAALTLDGRPLVISCSSDYTVRIWDAHSGEHRHVFEGHTAEVTSVATMSQNGDPAVVSGSADKTIRIWGVREALASPPFAATEPRRGEPRTAMALLATLTGHKRAVRSLATATLDGRAVIASGGDDSAIRIWDAVTGEELGHLNGDGGQMHSVVFATLNGAPVIVSGTYRENVRIWDARTGRLLRELDGTHNHTTVAAMTLDGDLVVVAGGTNPKIELYTIGIWDVRTGNLLRSMQGHTNAVGSVKTMDLDGAPVVVSGGGGTVRIWNARTGDQLREFDDCGSPVAITALDGATAIVARGADGESVLIRDARTGVRMRQFFGHTAYVTSITTMNLNGNLAIVSGSSDLTIRIWDARTGEQLRSLTGHSGRFGGVECVASIDTKDGPIVVSGGADDTVRLWDPRG